MLKERLIKLLRFSRFQLLVGPDSLNYLFQRTVFVLGCGGVGGYVVEALARSGVGTIILADFDVVSESNLNRQIVALTSTIGKKKIDVLADRVLDIYAKCQVIKLDRFVGENDLEEICSSYSIDFFVDACDSVRTKMSVISYCTQKKLPFLSCMGMGNRLDPSQLKIVDIRKTMNDPLARILRKYVRDQKINSKVMVVASFEVPIQTGDKIVGSSSFVPASAGLLIASYVVRYFLKDNKKNVLL